MPSPRVLIPTIVATDRAVALDAADAHHLLRVLHMAVGDEVRVFDGRGREWLAHLASAGRASASLDIIHEVTPAPEPHVRVTLAIGLLKGEQMDAVVRDATMLGAFSIVPITTKHVAVPSRAWKSNAAIERWQRVAVASAKQCGRAVVPQVGAVAPFAQVLTAAPGVPSFMCVEPALAIQDAAGVKAGARPVAAMVFVGPEGGWSAEEVEQGRAAGATLVHLGPRTLRAETVPTVVLTALWTAWGW
jgi:16S rRNA (uracil1498-N3)-methyltransferase